MLFKQQRELLLGSLLGSAVAAAAVLLLTPASGAKIRSRLQEYLRGEKPKKLRQQMARALPGRNRNHGHESEAETLSGKSRPKRTKKLEPHPTKKQPKSHSHKKPVKE